MKFVMPKPRLVFMVECESCSDAQRGGVKDLIFHYADKHCIPTEWPSERASRLTGTEATKPYTTIAATRKRRRKQTTPRPLNSFMIFAQHIRRNVLAVFEAASSSDVSRLLGDAWNAITKDVRAAYDDEASRLAKLHNIEFPDYKYQPRPRLWQTSSTAPSQGVFGSTKTVPPAVSRSRSYENPPPQAPPTATSTSISCPGTTRIISTTSVHRTVAKASVPVVNLVKIKPEPPSTPPPSLKSKPLIRDILPIPPKMPKLLAKPSSCSSEHIASASPRPGSTSSTSPPQTPLLRVESKPMETQQPQQQQQDLSLAAQPSLVASLPLLQSLVSQLSAQQRPANPPVVNLIAHIPAPEKTVVNSPPPPPQPAQISLQTLLAQLIAQQTARPPAVEQQAASKPATRLAIPATPVNQASQPPPQSTPKPCVLLTPIQSDIGQQAILACGQSSAMPTLLTCGNTIYVALSVLQSPLPTNAVVAGVPASPGSANGGGAGLSLADLLQTLQNRPSAESRLAELLRVAQASAATSSGQ